MAKVQNDPLLQVETTCGSLLYELQIIWDEVGESEGERDKMLLELEQECLEVYRRKVDKANRCRAQLRQAIADSEAELASICSAMGERPVHIRQSDQNPGSLKEELKAILPQIEEMRKRKSERRNQFGEVLEQIQKISSEIQRAPSSTIVDETDLSLRKLEELHRELEALQKEKSDRLKQVLELLNTLNSLCLVLGVDFKQTVSEVHPSLGCDSEGSKNISNHTIEQLGTAIQRLREVKLHRMQRLQDLGTSMLELWNLMDTPLEEQQMFQTVTCNIAASEHEINEPNMLSVEFMDKVEVEVSRLEELKASKMKELVFKKRSELDEICRKTHLIPESDSAMEVAIEAIESGVIDPSCVLEQIELQIAKVKEEAFSRKEILEKVEKWLGACEEESWLEEYNMDENRYNAGRGAHLTLKRAEKARALVNKLPGMVESLASKVESWERERDAEFIYDGISLLNMLDEYNILRQQKEQEKKRQRDQKKLQGQLIAEQEVLYGSKPSPMKMQSAKKTPRLSTGGGGGGSSRRLSMGTTALQAPKADALSSIRTTPLSAGRRGLDIAGLPLKKHSLNAVNLKETDSPLKRRPFSPICVKESSKTNLMDDLNKKHTDSALQKTHFSTPSKTPTAAAAEEENWTPKAAATTIPLPPPTPSTATIPMVTAMTPAAGAFKPVEDVEEEVVEYSFEERRAGFVLPRNQLNTALNV